MKDGVIICHVLAGLVVFAGLVVCSFQSLYTDTVFQQLVNNLGLLQTIGMACILELIAITINTNKTK